MNRSEDRRLNLWLGAAFLAALACGGLYLAIKPMVAAPPEPARRFVAYFDDAGGISKGDVVRIKGRRAGSVLDATVVRRDGRSVVRVEFEIAPGSGSTWLRDGAIAADSEIRIRPAGMLGRPSISITIGNDTSKLIREGEEWKRAKGVSGVDQFTQWSEELRKIEAGIDQFIALVSDREMIDNLKAQVAELRQALAQAQERVEAGMAQSADFEARLEEMRLALAELNQELEAQGPQLSNNISRLHEQLAETPKALEDASENIEKIHSQVLEFGKSLESSTAGGNTDELSSVLRSFRRLSATLRASCERAAVDPKQAGDMPPWRLSRRFFNGGETVLEPADRAEAASPAKQPKIVEPPRQRPTKPEEPLHD